MRIKSQWQNEEDPPRARTHTRTGFQWASGGRGLPPGTALWEAGVVQSMVARARAFQTLRKRLRGTLKFCGGWLGGWVNYVAVSVLETC